MSKWNISWGFLALPCDYMLPPSLSFLLTELCFADSSQQLQKSSTQNQWRVFSQLDTRTVCCPHFLPPSSPSQILFQADHFSSAISVPLSSLWTLSPRFSIYCTSSKHSWPLLFHLGFRSSTHPRCGLWWRAAGWSLDLPAGTLWTGRQDPRLCPPQIDRHRWVYPNPMGVSGLMIFFIINKLVDYFL